MVRQLRSPTGARIFFGCGLHHVWRLLLRLFLPLLLCSLLWLLKENRLLLNKDELCFCRFFFLFFFAFDLFVFFWTMCWVFWGGFRLYMLDSVEAGGAVYAGAPCGLVGRGAVDGNQDALADGCCQALLQATARDAGETYKREPRSFFCVHPFHYSSRVRGGSKSHHPVKPVWS